VDEKKGGSDIDRRGGTSRNSNKLESWDLLRPKKGEGGEDRCGKEEGKKGDCPRLLKRAPRKSVCAQMKKKRAHRIGGALQARPRGEKSRLRGECVWGGGWNDKGREKKRIAFCSVEECYAGRSCGLRVLIRKSLEVPRDETEENLSGRGEGGSISRWGVRGGLRAWGPS